MGENHDLRNSIISAVIVEALNIVLATIANAVYSTQVENVGFSVSPLYISLLALATIITGIFLTIRWHVRKQQFANVPTCGTGGGGHNTVKKSIPTKLFNVDWRVDYGTSHTNAILEVGEKPYPLVNGPFCPKCGYEMDDYQELSIFWKDRFYWSCQPCDKRYRRPELYLYREEDVVLKTVEKGLRIDKEMKRNQRRNPFRIRM